MKRRVQISIHKNNNNRKGQRMSRVQALAESGISEVPSQYIQPLDSRPTNSYRHHGHGIPVIDMEERDGVITRVAIGEACRDWGAFHVINHGVPLELIDQLRRVGLSFFQDCSLEEKLKYACDPNSPFASQGYGSKMLVVAAAAADSSSTTSSNDTSNNVLDWRDYFDHHTLPLSRRDPSRWPHFPPNYREVVSRYSDEMKVLAQKLLSLISQSLGLPSSCIEDIVGDFYQNITSSYYPPCPQPDLTLGLQSHSDMGAITLLIQDHIPGLQVYKDSQWITVPPLPHAILVLLADQTEIITNGKYRSAQHRVVTNRSNARLSIATFHDPGKAVKICPARELVSESSPSKYRDVKYGDYVTSWYTKGPEGKRNLDALIINY